MIFALDLVARAHPWIAAVLAANTLYDSHETRLRNRQADERAARDKEDRDAELRALRERVEALERAAKPPCP